MPSRAEWLEARKKGIGGSDAASVLGLNPWKSNVALWEEKTGRAEAEDISDRECVRYGVACEPLMREMFKLDFPEFRVEHEENSIIQHPKYPQLQASLDGQLRDQTGRLGILEIKTTTLNSRADRQQWKNAVPQNYFIQLLHYMLVTGAEFAILKARLRSEWGELWITEKHYRFERADHEEDLAYLLEKELAFWRMVETDTRPNLILPEL
ncbi:YqaJ viral recombinase family protein [Pseudodesulfovibrio tunisiensis]|uniref:YqaJ viral recombinase family protein n=1 Tax=Pseudodesulfovibrio tunisiensis TaxID=463192 RepID=UPI001FB4534B|nr:YqaJ viral recombinase family protein [Pseudodesulfovibrio tunisiensis]